MRGRGNIAALSWVSALSWGILIGLTGARAETASDLIANQRLLSGQVDQMAAIGDDPDAGTIDSGDRRSAEKATLAGSFPRSFLIPGTETSLKIGGTISEHVDYWLTGGPPNSSPQTINTGATGQVQAIPLANSLARARSNGIFQESPAPSRLTFETRTPTVFGEARTFLSMDWAGSNAYNPGGVNPTSVSDNLVPRLFNAYATLGNFLAGQANSNFRDADASAEVVEFGGNSGAPGVGRVAQVRWTIPTLWESSLSLAAETPETDIGTPAGVIGSDCGVGCAAFATGPGVAPTLPLNPTKSTAPDLTAAYYLPQPWGHIDLSTVVRPALTISDGQFFSKSFVGYGGHIGLNVQPGWFGWSKDNFTLQLSGGDGLGRYLNSSTNFSIATNYGCPSAAAHCGPTTYGAMGGSTSAASASLVTARLTSEWGTEIGYQHWWFPDLRSNISGGINHHDIPAELVGTAQAAAMNKELTTVHTNVIWNPIASVDIALEYMWGRRRVVNNQTGTEKVLINRLRVLF